MPAEKEEPSDRNPLQEVVLPDEISYALPLSVSTIDYLHDLLRDEVEAIEGVERGFLKRKDTNSETEYSREVIETRSLFTKFNTVRDQTFSNNFDPEQSPSISLTGNNVDFLNRQIVHAIHAIRMFGISKFNTSPNGMLGNYKKAIDTFRELNSNFVGVGGKPREVYLLDFPEAA